MTTTNWIDDLFGAIDRKDAEGFVSIFGDEPSFRFGNAPPVRGREAIREAVAGFFSAIQALEHRVQDSWQLDDATICRGDVRYTRHDGSQLEVPFSIVLTMVGDRVRDYQIYADASALFAPT